MKEETVNKHAKTINNCKVRYNTKEKSEVNHGNFETKEDQNKETKRKDVKMSVDDHN